MRKNRAITIFEYSDPFIEPSNGIENIVISLIKGTLDNTWVFVGATDNKDYTLGRRYSLKSQPNLTFIPVTYRSGGAKRMFPNSLRLLIGVVRFRKQLNPSLIHAHRIELGCIFSIMWRTSRIVQFIHNEASSLRKSTSSSLWKYFTKIHKIVERISLAQSYRVIVFNLAEYNRLIAVCKDSGKIFRATTWFDEENYFPASKAISAQGENEVLRLIWVGRFEREKNPSLVLDIANELRRIEVSFEIVMAGEGSLSVTIENLVRAMGLEQEITMVGRVDSEKLANHYRNSDVYISTSYYEGSPTTLVEAMACGLPCVCNLASDPDFQIRDGVDGFRISGHNAQNFASAILEAKNLSRETIHLRVVERGKNVSLPHLIDISVAGSV